MAAEGLSYSGSRFASHAKRSSATPKPTTIGRTVGNWNSWRQPTAVNRRYARTNRRGNATLCLAAGEGADGETRDIKVRLDDGEWFDLRLVCGAGQRLVETRVELPLGVVMEEREGAGIVVCEVAPDSNSAKAVPRVEEGDRLLAVSAIIKTMTFPVANVMLGGIGRPSLKRVIIQTEKLSFSSCMDAVRSNSEFDGVTTMVLLRDLGEVAEPEPTPKDEPVFDPRIFE